MILRTLLAAWQKYAAVDPELYSSAGYYHSPSLGSLIRVAIHSNWGSRNERDPRMVFQNSVVS
jgi:hypothetical protein